jgi:hypothetical protein
MPLASHYVGRHHRPLTTFVSDRENPGSYFFNPDSTKPVSAERPIESNAWGMIAKKKNLSKCPVIATTTPQYAMSPNIPPSKAVHHHLRRGAKYEHIAVTAGVQTTNSSIQK